MKDLNNIAVFVKVAEARNFTDASISLGLTKSAISKTIGRLEAELEVRLFDRTTRAMKLTSDGVAFLDRCRELLAGITDAEDAVRQRSGTAKGTLRITMPTGFGRRVISPVLPEFLADHPQIVIEAELTDRVVDLSYEPIDIAIIRGPVPDDRLIAKTLCTLGNVACASPVYLDKHGVPNVPEDLNHHHCLAYMGPQMTRYRAWRFARDGRTFALQVGGRLNMNSSESLLEAAIGGLGIVMLNSVYTVDAIRTGQLVPILTDFIAPRTPVSAIYLPNRNLSLRTKLFLEFLQRLGREYEAASSNASLSN